MIDLVKKEAENLRKFTTKKEKKNLSFEKLDPDSIKLCIYGQMTGDCFSNRANDLILKSCERVYKAAVNADGLIAKAKLNGPPYKVNYVERQVRYFSPIEKYIVLKKTSDKSKKNLIAYIKGEIDYLDIK
jgi:hypothetical protein